MVMYDRIDWLSQTKVRKGQTIYNLFTFNTCIFFTICYNRYYRKANKGGYKLYKNLQNKLKKLYKTIDKHY